MKRFLSVLLIALCLVAFVTPADAFHGVRMDYAAAGSSGITVADNNNLDYGTGNFFGGTLASLPDYTPSAEVILDHKHDGANGRIFSVQTNGKLRLTINGTNYDSTVATGLTDGTQHFLSYSVTRETATVAGSILFGVDGAALGTAVSITAGAPATVSNASSQYIMGTSAIRSACTVSKFYSFNRALSAAEVLSLYQSGVATADQWGSQTAVYTSNFSVGTDSWAGPTGVTVTGNVDGINGSNDWLRVQRTGVGSGSGYCYRSIGAIANKRIKTTMTVFNPVGSGISYFRVDHGDYRSNVIAIAENTEVTATYYEGTGANYQTYLFFFPCDAAGAEIFIANGATYYLKTATVYITGATLDLEPSGIELDKWYDKSTNYLDASYPSTGYYLMPKIFSGIYKRRMRIFKKR